MPFHRWSEEPFEFLIKHSCAAWVQDENMVKLCVLLSSIVWHCHTHKSVCVCLHCMCAIFFSLRCCRETRMWIGGLRTPCQEFAFNSLKDSVICDNHLSRVRTCATTAFRWRVSSPRWRGGGLMLQRCTYDVQQCATHLSLGARRHLGGLSNCRAVKEKWRERCQS